MDCELKMSHIKCSVYLFLDPLPGDHPNQECASNTFNLFFPFLFKSEIEIRELIHDFFLSFFIFIFITEINFE